MCELLHFKAQDKQAKKCYRVEKERKKNPSWVLCTGHVRLILGVKGHSPSSTKICLPSAPAVAGVPLPLSRCPPSSITILYEARNSRKTQQTIVRSSEVKKILAYKELVQFFCEINNNAVPLRSAWSASFSCTLASELLELPHTARPLVWNHIYISNC